MSLIMGQGFLFRVWVCMHLCYLYMKMHDVCENPHLFWLCGNKIKLYCKFWKFFGKGLIGRD